MKRRSFLSALAATVAGIFGVKGVSAATSLVASKTKEATMCFTYPKGLLFIQSFDADKKTMTEVTLDCEDINYTEGVLGGRSKLEVGMAFADKSLFVEIKELDKAYYRWTMNLIVEDPAGGFPRSHIMTDAVLCGPHALASGVQSPVESRNGGLAIVNATFLGDRFNKPVHLDTFG